MVMVFHRRAGWLWLVSVLVALASLTLARDPLLAEPEALEDQAGAWTSGPSLGTSRTEVAAAVLDGVLHVVGQYPGSSGPPGAHEAFDPRVGRWETRAALPADVNHACAAAIDGVLYVVGGY